MRTAKNMSCSKIIRRRRREAETRNGYIQLLARIILVIVCGGLLFTQGFLLMRAPDNGMFPAIKGGDLLIGFRLQRNFLKNDVVVYKANGKLQVGRILGQETDVITIDDTGQLLVNGTPQTGEIAFPTYAKKGIKKYPYRVPKGCVFLLGDYRTQTKDSRDYGPIKMWFPLWRKKGFDILLTHAAAYGVDDANDWAHMGFECFVKLLDIYRPKYYIHGHIHLNYGGGHTRRQQYGETEIINGYQFHKFEYETGKEIKML